MSRSFWRWMLFWLCVPLFWLGKKNGYWTDGNAGYLYFNDFRKAVLGD